MTPSIAALLGRWFWWPQRVRPRPASYMLRPFKPRRLVRSLSLGEDADAPISKLPGLSGNGSGSQATSPQRVDQVR
jgi:putative drug exporter of the RND superfamily